MNKFYTFCSFLARTFYRIFFKLEIEGAEKIDFDKQYVICANHQSMHDPFLLGGLMPLQAHFMAKKETFKYKIVAFVLNKVDVFPVDRNNNDIKAIKMALTFLKQKKNLALFPEGTRNKGRDPLHVKGGVAMLAYKTHTPVLPITIDTQYKWFRKIRIVYHEPVNIVAAEGEKLDSAQLEVLAKGIMDRIYAEKVYFK
jgi:1-acyl-sn-glycerol-3-phosphate acyltransferase